MATINIITKVAIVVGHQKNKNKKNKSMWGTLGKIPI
jgi:hypothetical protein